MFSEIRQFDLMIHSWLESFRMPLLDQFFGWVTLIADPIPMLLLSAGLIVTLVIQKDWKETLVADIALLGGLIIHYVLKILVGRIRPEGAELIETTSSFPSGHSTMAVIFLALLVFFVLPELKNLFLKRILQILSFCLMILIPFSRMYLGLHWFSDVVAGMLLGMVIVVASVFFGKKYSKR